MCVSADDVRTLTCTTTRSSRRTEPNRASIYSSVGGSFVRSFVRSGGFDDDDDDDDARAFVEVVEEEKKE